MTDPTHGSAPARRQLDKVFMLAAAMDLLLGLVLAAVGLSQDESVLTIIGVTLAVTGAVVTAWLIVRSNRPTEL